MEKLLSHKANVNSKDKEGNTPLKYAVKNNDCDTVNLLINAGAYKEGITSSNDEINKLLNSNNETKVSGDTAIIEPADS